MLIIKGLQKHFGKTVVLQGLSLEAYTPDPIVILGSSGSGKTTLLRLIAGLEAPDAGEIHLSGTLASRVGWLRRPHERGIGFVFQTAALWPHMTVAQNILYGLNGTKKNQARERLYELLERIDLKGFENRYPDELSGGEARRVSLARCLAPKPPFLLMDEPLTHLDPTLKEKMLGLVTATALETKALLIFVTHEQAEGEQIGGRLFHLRHGRLEQ
jgi:iron(III) transport system ATP-binding protein